MAAGPARPEPARSLEQMTSMPARRASRIVRETGATTIHYLCDFGESWDHVIKLERWFENMPTGDR
ncbi:hypothetical protein ACQ3JU_1290 (plasmid) [Bradyrhizobium guangxiense]